MQVRWIVFSLVALAAIFFAHLALFSPQKWFRGILTNRFLVYTGAISYGIYLLQKTPVDAAKSRHLRRPLLALVLTAAVTYATATLSWNLLEKPFLKLKRFFDAKTVYPTSPAPALAGASK